MNYPNEPLYNFLGMDEVRNGYVSPKVLHFPVEPISTRTAKVLMADADVKKANARLALAKAVLELPEGYADISEYPATVGRLEADMRLEIAKIDYELEKALIELRLQSKQG